MRVKCISLRPFDGVFACGCRIVEGGIYNVVDEENGREGLYYELAEDIGTYYASEMFVPYNPPYSNSVSKELAEKAMKPVIEVDGPLKEIKELQTN